jgi:tetratricopeptide (TPR) repeat protein
MSPEQLQGKPADVRSDVFCFCVALYEGLAGVRPFTGGTIDGLRAAIARGPDRERLAAAKVPAFLERALVRGLQAEPSQRHQTMAELLAELERGPIAISRRRRALALAAVAIVGGLGIRAVLRARAQVCEGAPAGLAAVWSGERRARLTSAAPKKDADALASFVSTLDSYFGAWTSMRREACEASRIRGEQSEQVLDLRMACLDRSLRNADALVTAVEQRSGASLKGASSAVAQLPPLSLCANTQALQAVGPLPPDPALRERVTGLHKRVAAIEAARILGLTTLAPEAKKLVEEVRELHYAPLLAEALLALGGVEDKAAEVRADAPSSCFVAAVTALAAHDDALAARAFTRLVRFENYARRFPEAHQWAALASAAIERLGGDEALELTRFTELARVVRNEGDLEAALDLAQKVLSRALRLDGPASGRVMGAHHDVAQALVALGRYDEGVEEERKALQMALAAHGERHARTVLLRQSLGIAETRRGRFAEGARELEIALAGNESLAGPEHPDTGDSLLNLAENLRAQGRAAEGLPLARRAAAIYRKRLGDKHPRAAIADGMVGELLLATGDARSALEPLESALALAGRGDSQEMAEIKLALGEALWRSQRDRPRAQKLLSEARAFYATLAARQPRSPFQAQLAHADELLAHLR